MLESERTSAQELESLLTSFNAGWYRKPPIVRHQSIVNDLKKLTNVAINKKTYTHIYKNNNKKISQEKTQCSKIIT